MIETTSSTTSNEGLLSFYYLLILADGHISESEIKMGEIMRRHEDIEKDQFDSFMKNLNHKQKREIYANCISALKHCDHNFKLKCVAWMSLIANSDGFMAPDEWRLLHRIYASELHLNLNEILAYQKKLPKK